MCGRFNYSNTKRLEGDLPPRYNIAPGTNILVVNEDNKPQIVNWGYSPAWMKSGMIINAKRETLKSKPASSSITLLLSEPEASIIGTDGLILDSSILLEFI